MGIKGLLRNTKSVGKRRHISFYWNKNVGIDGYAWMHRAIYSSPEEIHFNKNLKGIFNFFK